MAQNTTMSAPTPYNNAEKYPILIAPHAMLRRKMRQVTPDDMDRVRTLIPGMYRTMYEAPGIGLAAPQIDIDLRLLVVDTRPERDSDEKSDYAPITLINPEIIAQSDELATREEGCLSLPGQYADITRPARVRVRYRDETYKMQEIEGSDLLAACLQHEIDHLNGVLLTDHLSPLKRNMLMRKLAKEQRRKPGS